MAGDSLAGGPRAGAGADVSCWAGLVLALAGLWQCLRLPWAVDVLPGGWHWVAARPAADAAGSVQALTVNQNLGGAWPSVALGLAMAVRDVWVVAVAAMVLIAVARWRRPGLLPRRGMAWLRAVAWVVLTVVPLAAATVGAQAVRAVGVHALPGLVALPVPLMAGAVLSALWLRPWRRARPAPEPGPLSAVTGTAISAAVIACAAGLAVGAGAIGFARWYTTGRLVTSTVSGLPSVVAGRGPARPGRAAWRSSSPWPQPVVVQHAGYTVVATFDDTVRGGVSGEVRVLDSATGRLRWRYQDAGARLEVIDVTAGTLVLRAVDPADRSRLVGLDLASGRQLWSAAPRYLWPADRMYSPPEDSPLVYVAGAATVRGTLDSAPSRLTAGDGLEERWARAGANFASKTQLGCRLEDVVARQDRLVTRESCPADRLKVSSGSGPGWSVTLPPGYGSQDAIQMGASVVAAVISPPASSDRGSLEWLFYRLADGRLLWRSRTPMRQVSGDLLGGNLVVQQAGATRLTVRNALNGRVVWQSSVRALGLTAGELDSRLVASGDRVYALWSNYGLKHVSLLSFGAATGQLVGVTDLTRVTGDSCHAPLSLVPLRVGACQMMTLDAAGGGMVLVTATSQFRTGRFHDTIIAIADGPGFKPTPARMP